jgi:hypothetical protein
MWYDSCTNEMHYPVTNIDFELDQLQNAFFQVLLFGNALKNTSLITHQAHVSLMT